MTRPSLRTASILCLALWAAVWLLFLVMRLGPFDVRTMPDFGPALLVALGVAIVTPIVATVLAGVALVRQPRVPLNWITLGCAIVVFVGQTALFVMSAWLCC
jgi:hypothetical protein